MDPETPDILAPQVDIPSLTQNARISVLGLDHTGTVLAACLAGLGHQVSGVDPCRNRAQQIARGQSPFHEAGLSALLHQGIAAGRITAGTDPARAVRESDVTFLSLDTSRDPARAPDPGRQITQAMGAGLRARKSFHVFVLYGCPRPGQAMRVLAPGLERHSGKRIGRDFGICVLPARLRRGSAIHDFHVPPRTVIGAGDMLSTILIRRILAPIEAFPIVVDLGLAELIGLVDAAWLASKRCFANEIGRLCKSMRLDGHLVMEILCRNNAPGLPLTGLDPAPSRAHDHGQLRAFTRLGADRGLILPLIDSLAVSARAQGDTAPICQSTSP